MASRKREYKFDVPFGPDGETHIQAIGTMSPVVIPCSDWMGAIPWIKVIEGEEEEGEEGDETRLRAAVMFANNSHAASLPNPSDVVAGMCEPATLTDEVHPMPIDDKGGLQVVPIHLAHKSPASFRKMYILRADSTNEEVLESVSPPSHSMHVPRTPTGEYSRTTKVVILSEAFPWVRSHACLDVITRMLRGLPASAVHCVLRTTRLDVAIAATPDVLATLDVVSRAVMLCESLVPAAGSRTNCRSLFDRPEPAEAETPPAQKKETPSAVEEEEEEEGFGLEAGRRYSLEMTREEMASEIARERRLMGMTEEEEEEEEEEEGEKPVQGPTRGPSPQEAERIAESEKYRWQKLAEKNYLGYYFVEEANLVKKLDGHSAVSLGALLLSLGADDQNSDDVKWYTSWLRRNKYVYEALDSADPGVGWNRFAKIIDVRTPVPLVRELFDDLAKELDRAREFKPEKKGDALGYLTTYEGNLKDIKKKKRKK
jgi:hypothetical protein